MTVIIIDPGNVVLCDLCNEDYTSRDDVGGFVFQSKAVCPECAPKMLEDIKEYGEEHFIRGRCDGRSFADWIREEYR